MPPIQGRVLATLLASVLLIGAANLGAYAASGKPLIGGKTNTASKTTTIKTAKGPALSLKTKKSPPLKVNSKSVVRNLNADLLDGQQAAALKTVTYDFPLTGTSATNKITFALPGLPKGTYLATYAVTAQVYGGSTLICYFDNGQAERVITYNFASGAGRAFASGSGLLDTRSSTYVFECLTEGDALDVPSFSGPASVQLTRVDRVVSTPTTGTTG